MSIALLWSNPTQEQQTIFKLRNLIQSVWTERSAHQPNDSEPPWRGNHIVGTQPTLKNKIILRDFSGRSS